ncbi:MAG: hypothetical protein LLG02_01615, partial [Pelosinus sp.]|nr:hypothetical protein [Pelosinus sp.]
DVGTIVVGCFTGGTGAELMVGAKAVAKAGAKVVVKKVSKYAKYLKNETGAIGEGLGKAAEAASKAAKNVDEFKISNKHLQDAAGRWQKFNTNSKEEVNELIKEGLESPNAMFLPNNQPNSFKVIVDMGKEIGTKGETKLQVIVGDDGKIWTAYPVK